MSNFIFCCYSKTENWQWVLSAWSRTQNKEGEERQKTEHFLGTAKISVLGDMFMDLNPEVSNSSSSCENSSDEDFVTHHKKKRM